MTDTAFDHQAGEQLGGELPLYHQVYRVLLERINEEYYPEGEPLPSEPRLAEIFGVSRHTIRRTLDRLEAEGRVTRRRGWGTFPRKLSLKGPVRSNISSLSYEAALTETKVRILSYKTVKADEEVAHHLGLPLSAKIVRIERVRSYDGEPFSYSIAYLPETFGQLISKEALGQKTVHGRLEELGIIPTSADRILSASAADARVASILKVEKGAPLISMKMVVAANLNQPVEYLETLHRPDKYEYRVSLSRISFGRDKGWTPVG